MGAVMEQHNINTYKFNKWMFTQKEIGHKKGNRIYLSTAVKSQICMFAGGAYGGRLVGSEWPTEGKLGTGQNSTWLNGWDHSKTRHSERKSRVCV